VDTQCKPGSYAQSRQRQRQRCRWSHRSCEERTRGNGCIPERYVADVKRLHVVGALHVLMNLSSARGAKRLDGIHLTLLHLRHVTASDNGNALPAMNLVRVDGVAVQVPNRFDCTPQGSSSSESIINPALGQRVHVRHGRETRKTRHELGYVLPAIVTSCDSITSWMSAPI
jgi:hypothetical protein